MDCRETLEKLAAFSADCLPNSKCAEELRAHLKQCPPCMEQWTQFERTMFLVSSASQPLVSHVQSRAIWGACLEKMIADVERGRSSQAAGRASAATPLQSWLALQPRWSWLTLGGAIAVLGGVWLLAPHADTPTVETPEDARNMQVISFERPPAAAYPFIDRHSAMAFDGFNDHVGSTMVSYSATAPVEITNGPGSVTSRP